LACTELGEDLLRQSRDHARGQAGSETSSAEVLNRARDATSAPLITYDVRGRCIFADRADRAGRRRSRKSVSVTQLFDALLIFRTISSSNLRSKAWRSSSRHSSQQGPSL
jgi:hypothetical protein